MKIKILLNFHGKYSKNVFREIDLFDFTSFMVWTFFNFPAHCARRDFTVQKFGASPPKKSSWP